MLVAGSKARAGKDLFRTLGDNGEFFIGPQNNEYTEPPERPVLTPVQISVCAAYTWQYVSLIRLQ